ncbi:MAG: hypothetical protein JW896_17735 [Deltaproteobacteria bacterium]|nr:hypothetical protein [Deltaproteobacteria bacterium]
MNKILIFTICLLALCSGCADHYYKTQEDGARIYLKYPEAQQVFFLSSLDGYERHEARKTDDKIWEMLVHVDSEFKYFYIVDGEPFLPACPLKERDDFGSENCIFSTER